MIVRRKLWMSTAGLAIVLCNRSLAQNQEPPAADSVAITITELRAELQKFASGLATQQQLNDAIRAVTDLVQEQDAELKRLRNELDQQKDSMQDLSGTDRRLIESIARQDSQGNPVLALSNIMQASPDFRREMSDAVQSSMQQRGKLVVKNQMGATLTLAINGRLWNIPPSETPAEVEVPVGTVTTELVGYEAAKNWSVGPPNYRQTIVIGTSPIPLAPSVLTLGPLVRVQR